MYDSSYMAEDCSYQDFADMFANVENFFDKYNVKSFSYTLTGGSPLMNKECADIFRLLHSNSKNIGLLDIPEMVTDENLALLKQYDIQFYQVSLDGLEKTHDDIRGVGSFKRTIDACRRLYKQVGIVPNIMFTLSMDNYGE